MLKDSENKDACLLYTSHVSGLQDRIFRPEIIVIEIPVCIEHIRKKIPRNPALSGLRIKDRRIKLPQPRKNFGLAARIFQRKRSRILRTSEDVYKRQGMHFEKSKRRVKLTLLFV